MKPAIWAEIHQLHEIEQLSDRQIAIEVGCSRYKVTSLVCCRFGLDSFVA